MLTVETQSVPAAAGRGPSALACRSNGGHGSDVGKLIEVHRRALRSLADWMPYLTANSGLPGPRGNLELVAACGEEADARRAAELIATGGEFATVCGTVALGRLYGEGDDRHVVRLHLSASDQRWRVREGAAMAIQRAADTDPERGFALAELWATDPDPLVRRAAVAAVCEPRLLRDAAYADRALDLLGAVTRDLASRPSEARRLAGWRTLRQALGYGWSVAVAAAPVAGIAAFGRIGLIDDADVQWIIRENRKKSRLKKLLDHLG